MIVASWCIDALKDISLQSSWLKSRNADEIDTLKPTDQGPCTPWSHPAPSIIPGLISTPTPSRLVSGSEMEDILREDPFRFVLFPLKYHQVGVG